MTDHFLDKKTKSPWVVQGNNGDWIVTANGEIFAMADGLHETAVGIYEDDLLVGNDIILKGEITAFGGETMGIYSEGKNTDITVGVTGEINASRGVYSSGANSRIFNQGEIDASIEGIHSDKAVRIVNGGEITANVGISSGMAGAAIVNQSDGLINALYGIWTHGASAIVTNLGIVQGVEAAIFDGTGDAIVRNRGTILGNVALGDGKDIFANFGGKVFGSISGGKGDDTYRVDKASLFVIEADNEGVDTVFASVSYTLSGDSGEIESLRAAGTKNINLTGNNGDNSLVGNVGNNLLDGDNGADHLQGRGGNDRLRGGEGIDIFDFARGCGTDTILDFEQGSDLIQLDGYNGIAFGDLAARTSDIAAGTKITLLNGDSILLKDVHGITLTIDDYLI